MRGVQLQQMYVVKNLLIHPTGTSEYQFIFRCGWIKAPKGCQNSALRLLFPVFFCVTLISANKCFSFGVTTVTKQPQMSAHLFSGLLVLANNRMQVLRPPSPSYLLLSQFCHQQVWGDMYLSFD